MEIYKNKIGENIFHLNIGKKVDRFEGEGEIQKITLFINDGCFFNNTWGKEYFIDKMMKLYNVENIQIPLYDINDNVIILKNDDCILFKEWIDFCFLDKRNQYKMKINKILNKKK